MHSGFMQGYYSVRYSCAPPIIGFRIFCLAKYSRLPLLNMPQNYGKGLKHQTSYLVSSYLYPWLWNSHSWKDHLFRHYVIRYGILRMGVGEMMGLCPFPHTEMATLPHPDARLSAKLWFESGCLSSSAYSALCLTLLYTCHGLAILAINQVLVHGRCCQWMFCYFFQSSISSTMFSNWPKTLWERYAFSVPSGTSKVQLSETFWNAKMST